MKKSNLAIKIILSILVVFFGFISPFLISSFINPDISTDSLIIPIFGILIFLLIIKIVEIIIKIIKL